MILQVWTFLTHKKNQCMATIEPPRPMEKSKGFGHLKTRWFTIESSKHVGFGGPMVYLHLHLGIFDDKLFGKHSIHWAFGKGKFWEKKPFLSTVVFSFLGKGAKNLNKLVFFVFFCYLSPEVGLLLQGYIQKRSPAFVLSERCEMPGKLGTLRNLAFEWLKCENFGLTVFHLRWGSTRVFRRFPHELELKMGPHNGSPQPSWTYQTVFI